MNIFSLIQGQVASFPCGAGNLINQIYLNHRYVGERLNPNPMEDPMNRCYELPNLGSSCQQGRADRPEPLDRQTEGFPSIGALRLVNGLKSAVRMSVGTIFRWRRRRTAIRELQALSDHHLKDIGLDRSQIVSTVEEMIETSDQPA